MTVSSSTNKVIGNGNGATTSWPFSFKCFDATHLVVTYTDAAGDESTLSSSAYTVSLNSDQDASPGGAVTYNPAIATGTKLTILREVPYTQATDIKNQGGYFPEVLERAIDLIVMQVQQIKEQLTRAFKLSPSQSAIGELEATDANRANTFLGFGPTGLLTLFTGLASQAVSLAMQPVIAAASLAAARAAMGLGGLAVLTKATNADLADMTGFSLKGQVLGSGAAAPVDMTAAQALAGLFATAALQSQAISLLPLRSGVRQTVQNGPIDTAGLPSFLPSTDADLNLASQNISASARFEVNAAGGGTDRFGASEGNLTWAGLTASRAAATPNFLYVTVGADGVLTTGHTIVAPIYQQGGTPATTAGLITFNVAEMKAYLGNGTTAPQTYIVIVGEAATDGTGVISTVAYAYNGRYDSGWIATLPGPAGGITSKNANLGVRPRTVDVVIECTTTDLGYPVGAQLLNPSIYDSANVRTIHRGSTGNNAVYFIQATWSNQRYDTFVGANLTEASWKYKVIADRGW